MICQVRSLTIPHNRKGLPEGQWLRVPELYDWLCGNGYQDAAERLIEDLRHGPELLRREHTVRVP